MKPSTKRLKTARIDLTRDDVLLLKIAVHVYGNSVQNSLSKKECRDMLDKLEWVNLQIP